MVLEEIDGAMADRPTQPLKGAWRRDYGRSVVLDVKVEMRALMNKDLVEI